MKKPNCSYDDFVKLDIRVGEVKEASLVEGSKKLISLMVDLGEDFGTVEILTGMQEWYGPEDFVGKKFLFLANLEPRPMMGHVSNGMLLSADTEEKPILNSVSSNIPNGTIVR
jgi:methionine--tRNA ligase beta chain